LNDGQSAAIMSVEVVAEMRIRFVFMVILLVKAMVGELTAEPAADYTTIFAYCF